MSDTTNKPEAPKQLALPDQLLPPNLFVLPINSPIVFPTLIAPLLISQPRFVASVEEAIQRHRYAALLLTKDGEVTEATKSDNLYTQGVAVKILKRIKMPDGSVNLLVHSIKLFKVEIVLSEYPHIVV